jgi:hypothetical protein
MSLDFDTSKIKDRKVKFPPDEHGKMNDTLHVLIWNALAIDIGDITEENVDEVWWRTDMWQRLIGAQFQTEDANRAELLLSLDRLAMPEDAPLFDDWYKVWKSVDDTNAWVPFLLTREDIVKGIGLHTNVGLSTRHQFIKKVTGRFQA